MRVSFCGSSGRVFKLDEGPQSALDLAPILSLKHPDPRTFKLPRRRDLVLSREYMVAVIETRGRLPSNHPCPFQLHGAAFKVGHVSIQDHISGAIVRTLDPLQTQTRAARRA